MDNYPSPISGGGGSSLRTRLAQAVQGATRNVYAMRQTLGLNKPWIPLPQIRFPVTLVPPSQLPPLASSTGDASTISASTISASSSSSSVLAPYFPKLLGSVLPSSLSAELPYLVEDAPIRMFPNEPLGGIAPVAPNVVHVLRVQAGPQPNMVSVYFLGPTSIGSSPIATFDVGVFDSIEDAVQLHTTAHPDAVYVMLPPTRYADLSPPAPVQHSGYFDLLDLYGAQALFVCQIACTTTAPVCVRLRCKNSQAWSVWSPVPTTMCLPLGTFPTVVIQRIAAGLDSTLVEWSLPDWAGVATWRLHGPDGSDYSQLFPVGLTHAVLPNPVPSPLTLTGYADESGTEVVTQTSFPPTSFVAFSVVPAPILTAMLEHSTTTQEAHIAATCLLPSSYFVATPVTYTLQAIDSVDPPHNFTLTVTATAASSSSETLNYATVPAIFTTDTLPFHHSFTLTATATHAGASEPSAPSIPFGPLIVPDPAAPGVPQIVAITSLPFGGASVVFDAASDGIHVATFTLQVFDGDVLVTSIDGTSSPLTIDEGLDTTSTKAYTFVVVATNTVGSTSSMSGPTNHVLTPPPTNLHVQPGRTTTSLFVWFDAPTPLPEGVTVAGFTVTALDATTHAIVSSTDGTSSPILLTDGLTAEGSYVFFVVAHFAGQVTTPAGATPTSSASLVTSMGLSPSVAPPAAPTHVVAVASDSSALVSFDTPSLINDTTHGETTSFAVDVFASADGSGPIFESVTDATSPTGCTGLVNGTTYTMVVHAINAGGDVASTISNAVVPSRRPGAPSNVIASRVIEDTASIRVLWDAAAANGSAVSLYTVTPSPLDAGATPQETSSGTPTQLTIDKSLLTIGIAYTFSVTATNATGTSDASVSSNSVVPAILPAAPTITSVSAGNAAVTVAFVSPSNFGGAPIVSYMATAVPGGQTSTGPQSPLVVAGLVNGADYMIMVQATNEVGTGVASLPSLVVTPFTSAPAPSITSVEIGNRQATIAFMEPTSDGGSAIQFYTIAVVAPVGGGPPLQVSGSASPLVLTGLTNGVTYSLTATATNAAGTGAASSVWTDVTPATVPDAPIIGAATSGNTQVSVAFSAPASTGGSPITSFTATSSPDGFTATGASSPLVVNGLTNGTSYTFRVAATNAAGTGVASEASIAVIPATVPDPPTILSTTSGNSQVSVAFQAPTQTGGRPVTSYTVTSTPGSFTQSGSASPLVVMGLTNGTPYTFVVVAMNDAGSSTPSSASTSIVPATMPSAPTSVSANVNGSGSVSVSFATPASNGGAAISTYTVTSSPGGRTATTPNALSPVSVTGLTNGVTYTFSVTATNVAGTSVASATSNAVTPITTPDAPLITSVLRGNAKVDISFVAPLGDGGSSITLYTATSSPGGYTGTSASPDTPITVTGLTNGVAYTFVVRATNAAGVGLASSTSTPVTPATVPDAPTSVTATHGNASASVAFIAPSFNGGVLISSYTVTSSPGGFTGTGTTSPILVTGLTNGTSYTFTVVATNAVGSGVSSTASLSVVPTATPGAPTNVVASTTSMPSGSVRVSFDAPTNSGGSPITSFTVTSIPGGMTASGASSPIIVTGLTNGTQYQFFVTATSMAGTSVASANSNSVTPATTPSAPTSPVATAGNASASIAFVLPSSTGGSAIIGYTATSTPGGLSGSGSASPIVVSGLNNGTTYTFTVTATNAVGVGLASSATNAVTPATVPTAPTAIVATAGDMSASISFSAPSSNGGFPITGFTVTSSPGGVTGTGTSSPIVITGLTNGVTYAFIVTATTSYGTSPASVSSNSISPATIPTPPQNVSATPANASALIAFSPPISTGGAVISTYTATSNPGGFTASSASSPITVMGLTNGAPYTFTVTATNTAGTSVASSASASVTPITVPSAPTAVVATAGNASASVSFATPGDNGGSPITSFTVTSTPGAFTGSGTASPIVVNGLTNESSYTFVVTATNSAGSSAASVASASVTPEAPPIVTVAATAGSNGSLTSSGSQEVSVGDVATFTASPSAGYIIDSWTVGGVGVPSFGTSLDVVAVAGGSGNNAVTVSFKQRELFSPASGTFNATAITSSYIYVGGSFLGMCRRSGSFAPVSPSTGIRANSFAQIGGTGTTKAIVEDGSGGWFVGGLFTSVVGNTSTFHNILHLNADFSLAASQPPELPSSSVGVTCMLVHNGMLYVGGAGFYAIDLASNTLEVSVPVTGTVFAMAKYNNSIIIGGTFTVVDSVSGYSGLAWFDGFHDLMDWKPDISTVVNDGAFSLAVTGTVLIVGGKFSAVDGTARSNLAAFDLEENGALVSNWVPTCSSTVNAVCVIGSTLFVGGTFTTVNSPAVTRRCLAAFDLVTGATTSWNPTPVSASVVVNVLSFDVQRNRLLVGGIFTSIASTTRSNVAAFDATTLTLDSTWDPSTIGAVSCMAATSSSAIMIGGSFSGMNVITTRNYLAVLDRVTGLPTAWNAGLNASVNALVLNGTTLIAGGAFTTGNAGATNMQRLAAFTTSGSAASVPTFLWTTGFNNPVFALHDVGTTVYVGGSFTNAITPTGTVVGARTRLASLSATTGALTSWAPTCSATVATLTSGVNGFSPGGGGPGSSLYVGGYFATVEGVTRNCAAAFDLSSGGLTEWNPNLAYSTSAGFPIGRDTTTSSASVQCMLTHSQFGTVIIGGNFNNCNNGHNAANLVETSAVDAVYTTFEPNPVKQSVVAGLVVNSVKTDGASTMFVSGLFANIASTSRPGLASINLAVTPHTLTTWAPQHDIVTPVITGVNNGIVYVSGTGVFAQFDATTGVRL